MNYCGLQKATKKVDFKPMMHPCFCSFCYQKIGKNRFAGMSPTGVGTRLQL
jgi:hypothetical protein